MSIQHKLIHLFSIDAVHKLKAIKQRKRTIHAKSSKRFAFQDYTENKGRKLKNDLNLLDEDLKSLKGKIERNLLVLESYWSTASKRNYYSNYYSLAFNGSFSNPLMTLSKLLNN